MSDTNKNITATTELTSVPRVAENWRERFLRAVMRGALFFGLIALIPNIIQAPSRGFLFSYLIAYSLLVVLTFAPISYNLRASTTLLLIYGLGILGMIQDGLWGDTRLFFLAFVGISLLLYSPRAGVFALITSLVTLGAGWWLLKTGAISISNPEVTVVGSSITWITSGAMLLLISVLFISGLFIFQQDFIRTREQYRITLDALQKQRAELEHRVENRTHGLARKTEQLRVASYIARQAATLQDYGSLLSNTVELIAREFGHYHAGIYIINEKGYQAVLQSASSQGGKQMLNDGYSVELANADPVAIAAGKTKAMVVLDIGENAAIFNNPNLPTTRSQIVVPIILRGRATGVLDVQSMESGAFSQEDIDVFQSLADHLAISIENARLLNETQTILRQLEAVSTAQTADAWSERLKDKSQAYTYTSMGLRPEKSKDEDPNSLRVPISLRGHQIGAIALSRKEGEAWDENDQNLASKVASQVSLAIDNLRLLEEAQKSAQRDQKLTNISNRIRETLDMESILQSAAREFQRALNLKEAEVRLGIPDTLIATHEKPRKKQNTGTLRTRIQKSVKKDTQ